MKHWQQTIDSDNRLWLAFDRQGSSVNTINEEVIDELAQIIEEINANSNLRGLIIHSAKDNGFIFGADISQFTSVTDRNEIIALLSKGQAVFKQLENLSIPTVALIENGVCLGGGLELALACRYRLAEPTCKLGLPEVNLGIHPGWGGIVRLARLIGGMQAMSLILQGRIVSGKQAAKFGFVDAAVPDRHLHEAARMYIDNQYPRRKPSMLQAITNGKPLRHILAMVMRKRLAAKAQQAHYPHLYAALDIWLRYGINEEGLAAEVNSITDLITLYPTFNNLVRLFFLQERVKGLAKDIDFTAQHVHVIGAGVMGGAIAAWCALRGLTVTLQDREAELMGPAMKGAYKLFKKKLKEPRLIQAAMDRLQPDVSGQGIRRADVIIEAIFENLAAKQELFKSLEQQAKPGAILATNTSSIPLDEINQVLQQPERLVGIHFFNPVDKMQLVEIVHGEKSAAEIIKQATAFVRQINRLPLPVKSSPGFLVNRVLMPYIMEALAMMDEGVPAALIDKAAENFGMPMGPIELADTVGLDVLLSVGEYLAQYFPGKIPASLVKMANNGELGRKTGKGFYKYKNNKPIKEKITTESVPWRDIANRLILRMINEAAACLREQVVADADLLDTAMVFGTGFAPFRGGPMNYAASFSEGQLNKLFAELQQQHGERFAPDSEWHKLQPAWQE